MDFHAQLLDQARAARPERNPFLEGLEAGRFSPPALSLYAQRLRQLVEQFTGNLARVLAICPDRAMKRHILENYLEEEGFLPRDGHLEDAPSRAHVALFRRFTAALPPPPPDPWRSRNPHVDRWIGEGCWPAAAAFFFIGFEHSVPPTFRRMIPALEAHYHLGPEALEFFTEHLGADEVHAARGAAMLVAACRDEGSRALALEGAHRGAMTWYTFHRACARAMASLDRCPASSAC